MTPPRRLSGHSRRGAAVARRSGLGSGENRPATTTMAVVRAHEGGAGSTAWEADGTAGKEMRPKEPTRCVSLDVISAASRRSAPSGASATLGGGRPSFNRFFHLDRRWPVELSTFSARRRATCGAPKITNVDNPALGTLSRGGARLSRRPRTGVAARPPEQRQPETKGPARTVPRRRWRASAAPGERL